MSNGTCPSITLTIPVSPTLAFATTPQVLIGVTGSAPLYSVNLLGQGNTTVSTDGYNVFISGSAGGGGGMLSSGTPSVFIGLNPITGTAGTFMTSDSAPPLSQSISPTWQSGHTWNLQGLGNTVTGGIILDNSTLATKDIGTQNSPALVFLGAGWKAPAAAASQSGGWRTYLTTFSGTPHPTFVLNFDVASLGNVNTWNNVMSLNATTNAYSLNITGANSSINATTINVASIAPTTLTLPVANLFQSMVDPVDGFNLSLAFSAQNGSYSSGQTLTLSVPPTFNPVVTFQASTVINQDVSTSANVTFRSMTGNYAAFTTSVFANLPSPITGMRAFISDSTLSASGHFGFAAVGNGTFAAPVFYDGIWRIG